MGKSGILVLKCKNVFTAESITDSKVMMTVNTLERFFDVLNILSIIALKKKSI